MSLITEAVPTKVVYEPRRYLDEYFRELDGEYRALYAFWCAAVRALPRGMRALELGVGPALYSTFPLAERFRTIHLADYVPASLTEIRRWLRRDPEAFDWSPHVRLVLRAEGRAGTEREVAQRQAQLRRRVRKLSTCDVRSPLPLGKAGVAYDLVTAHYCTEAATTTLEEWRDVIRNIVGLIQPGGFLLLSVATQLTLYREYGSKPGKPSPNVSAADVEAALQAAGMDMASLQRISIPAPVGRPYGGSLLVFARKSAQRK